MLHTAFGLGITLSEFADYTPRLLLLHAQAVAEKRQHDQYLLAWLQANIMNRLRWDKKTKKVTIDGLLGRASQEYADEAQLDAEMRRRQEELENEDW